MFLLLFNMAPKGKLTTLSSVQQKKQQSVLNTKAELNVLVQHSPFPTDLQASLFCFFFNHMWLSFYAYTLESNLFIKYNSTVETKRNLPWRRVHNQHICWK